MMRWPRRSQAACGEGGRGILWLSMLAHGYAVAPWSVHPYFAFCRPAVLPAQACQSRVRVACNEGLEPPWIPQPERLEIGTATPRSSFPARRNASPSPPPFVCASPTGRHSHLCRRSRNRGEMGGRRTDGLTRTSRLPGQRAAEASFQKAFILPARCLGVVPTSGASRIARCWLAGSVARDCGE
jgi:hypothetical protein